MLARMKSVAMVAALFPATVWAAESPQEGGGANNRVPSYSYETTRVLVGECLFAQKDETKSAALVASLATFAIDAGLNLVSSALKSASEGGVKTFTGTGNFRFSDDSIDGACIQVIRGSFLADGTGIAGSPHPRWATSMGIGKAQLEILRNDHRMYLSRAPDFLFEGRMRKASEDGRIFTIRPLYTAFEEPYEKSSLDPRSGARHIALLFSFVTPGKQLDAAENPGAEVIVGKMDKGTHIKFDFPLSAKVYDESEDGRSKLNLSKDYVSWPQESRWFDLAKEDIQGPMTARVVVTETRSGSALFKFLSGAFDASSEELKTSLEQVLIPARKKEALLLELNAEAALNDAADLALITANDSLQECALAPAGEDYEKRKLRFEKSQAAGSEQGAANRAFIAASRPAPFSIIITASNDAGVSAKCETAMTI